MLAASRGAARLLAALLLAAGMTLGARDVGVTTRLLFGSCNRALSEQPMWAHVLAREPDVWIWAGDNVYGDKADGFDLRTGTLRRVPATIKGLRALYATQREVPGYQQLLRSNTTVLGTWDDHDFGVNDGDSHPLRAQSQMLMLNFLNEPALSPRRFQKGVYGAHLIRAPRPTSEAPASAKRARGRSGVLVVLLDVRYNKDPWGTPDGDFLGEAQWAWLERTLRGSRARAHLIVTGLQVHAHVTDFDLHDFPLLTVCYLSVRP
ncbi:hypothetical protein T492DRAFT_847371 [Pavlovales sp. CCMP2436]|nr:hypothetical protein T492DRAFT_847371 [Pavlovales sp. CCMP2436]